MRKLFKRTCLAAAAAALALPALTGCNSLLARFSEMDNPYCTVKESGLNWVEIRQYEMDGAKRRIHLRIDGNGIVDILSGTSLLVSNEFAYQNDSANWADVHHERTKIDPKDAVIIFQQLVDKGLFAKDEIPSNPAIPKHLAVFATANIEHKTITSVNPIVRPPELVEQLKLTVLMFYHPQPKRN